MSLFTAMGRPRSNGVWSILAAATSWGTVGVTTQAVYGISATNPLSIGFFGWRLLLPFSWS